MPLLSSSIFPVGGNHAHHFTVTEVPLSKVAIVASPERSTHQIENPTTPIPELQSIESFFGPSGIEPPSCNSSRSIGFFGSPYGDSPFRCDEVDVVSSSPQSSSQSKRLSCVSSCPSQSPVIVHPFSPGVQLALEDLDVPAEEAVLSNTRYSRVDAQYNPPLKAPEIQRLSISTEHFIHEATFDGKFRRCYGWYKRAFADDNSHERYINSAVHKFEDVLASTGVQRASMRKPMEKDNLNLNGNPAPKHGKGELYRCAILLGKLSLDDWYGHVLLYIDMTQYREAFFRVGIVGEAAVNNGNNAIKNRLKKIPYSPYRPSMTVNVGGTLFQWESVDATLPCDMSVKGCRDNNLFIAFVKKAQADYEKLFERWRKTFPSNSRLVPILRQTAAALKNIPTKSASTTTLSFGAKTAERLDNTTTQMAIPLCAEKFKVKGTKESQRNSKRVRETTVEVQVDSDSEDETADKTKNDLFPMDPEKHLLNRSDAKNMMSIAVDIKQQATAIRRLREKLRSELPMQQHADRRKFIEGIVAAYYYANLRWRIEQLEALERSKVEFVRKVTLDIDQTSLDVHYRENASVFCNKYPYNHSYLAYHMRRLIEKVLDGYMPSEMNTINYNLFCGLKGTGHTLHLGKEIFTLISDQSHEGEVFRVALSLTQRHSGSSGPREWQCQYDEVELKFLQDYGSKKIKDRIFIAMVLVARFLNSEVGAYQNEIVLDLLDKYGMGAVQGDNCITCSGGVLFHMLCSLQVAALEERLAAINPTSQSYYVTVSMETYGHKSRHVVRLSDLDASKSVESRASEVMTKLQLKPNCAINVIANFSRYCAEELHVKDGNRNNLYFGVGATCYGKDRTTESPLYAAFPLSKLRSCLAKRDVNRSMCPVTSDDKDSTQSEEHITASAENVELTNLCEGFNIPLQGRTNIILMDRHGNRYRVEPYPTWGGVAPSDVQPYTATMYLGDIRRMSKHLNEVYVVKWQHYSVDARYAVGEYGKLKAGVQATNVAASCLDYLSVTTELDKDTNVLTRVYRHEHHKQHLDQAKTCLDENCQFMKTRGNGTRMEVTCKSTMLEHSPSLCWVAAFTELLQVMDEALAFYDIAEDVATCTEFFGNGLRVRTDFVVGQLRASECSRDELEDALTFIVEEVGHWQRMYTGKHVFAAKAVICRKLALAANRPIISDFNPRLHELVLRHDLSPWLKDFLDATGVSPAASFHSNLMPVAQFEQIYTVEGYACRHCGCMTTHSSFMEHYCSSKILDPKTDIISVDSDEFAEFHRKWYAELDMHQRAFVDRTTKNVNKRRCYFLTGYAGCGKTRTLNCMIAKLVTKVGAPRVTAVSYTKSAANEVNGSSVHALFNWGKSNLLELTREDAVRLVRNHNQKEAVLINMHTLIIDEVSLLTGTALDLIECTLRAVRRNLKPFGGVQVILCGDCLQLPPIIEDYNQMQKDQLRQFFFEADAWFSSRFRVCYLQHIYRQSEMTDMLNWIRDGMPTEEHIKLINQKCGDGVSTKLLKFVIDEMAILNKRESEDNSIKKDKPIKCRFATKVKKSYIDRRCGHFYGEKLIPVNSSDSKVQVEMCARPLKNDVDDSEDIVTKMKSHFIVGVENVESSQFSTSMENIASKEVVITVNAVDKYYNLWGNLSSVTPEQADAAIEVVERGGESIDNGIIAKVPPLDITQERKKIIAKWRYSDESNRCEKLLLYRGQTVIFTSNAISKMIATNSQGVIEDIVMENGEVKELKIRPLTKQGLHVQEAVIVKKDRKLIGKEASPENNLTKYFFGIREQFPIKPACWATAYAVQGLTFANIKLIYNNIRARKDAYGYLYVLISRMQNIEDFCPVRAITPEDIIAHPKALAFDLFHRYQPFEENGQYHLHVVSYNREFDFNFKTLYEKRCSERC